jgi:hypothetical protein
MIRQLIIAVLLLSFLTTNAQVRRKGVTPINTGVKNEQKSSDYSLSQFKGKWQEFKRMDYRGNEVGFTDSLQINFLDSTRAETRTSISNSMSMTGAASVDGDNNLAVAADSYTIKSFGKNEMILDDDVEYLHQFKKVDQYWYETLGKVQVKQDSYDTSVKTSLSTIIGKWSIYKRQAKPGFITGDMQLLKYVNINVKTSDSTASGDVTFYQGQSAQQLPCTVSLNGSNIKIAAGANNWNLSVFQADGSNFIFGNEGLLYFSKKDN